MRLAKECLQGWRSGECFGPSCWTMRWGPSAENRLPFLTGAAGDDGPRNQAGASNAPPSLLTREMFFLSPRVPKTSNMWCPCCGAP